MIINILGLITGIAVGMIEFFLLGELTSRMTGVKRGRLSGIIIIKLAVYIFAVITVIFAFKSCILFCGIGYALGMLVTAGVTFAASYKRR